jgi:beta-glucosidase
MNPPANRKSAYALKSALLSALLISTAALAAAQHSDTASSVGNESSKRIDQPIPSMDRRAPYTPKVRDLLAALTLAEKLSLVYGASDPNSGSVGQVGNLPGVPRLGIPVRRDANALGIEVIAGATALPSRLGLGATFDREAVCAAGQLVGNEGRALGVDLVYGPQVDLTRLPNWARNNTT